MSSSMSDDIKKIIEEERLSKTAAATASASEEESSVPETATLNKQHTEPVLDVKPARAPAKKTNQPKKEVQETEIIRRIKDFEKESESFLLHVKVNKRVYDLANQLNAASKITVTKLINFSVIELFKGNPELEEAIKKHFKSLDL